MKKIWCLILALVLCMSVAAPAFADEVLEQKLTNAGFSGKKSSITIVVAQPIKGTRNAVAEYPSVDVGHTFIRLEKKTATGTGSYVSYFGFYPKDGVGRKDVAYSKDVEGKIYWNIGEYGHIWNVARTFEIPPAQADAVMNWASSYTSRYNIETNNCTTFAYNALIKAGISSTTTGLSKHTWTLPQSWKDEVPSFRFWYGYTPGDAGQDLRGKSNVFTN